MKKKCILLIALVVFSVSMTVSIAFAQQYDLTYSLIEGQYITVTPKTRIPESYETDDLRRGVLITAKNNRAEARFTPVFSGAFELDYRTYPDLPGLRGYTVCFSSDKGSFEVKVAVSGDERRFLVYADGIGFTDSGENVPLIVRGEGADVLRFDPNSMEVFVNDTKLWNFSYKKGYDYEHPFHYECFEKYQVKICFTDTSAAGNMLLYEINGQPLTDDVLYNDVAAPSIFAPLRANGVAGTKYLLPVPRAYDIFDKEIEEVFYQVTFGKDTVAEGQYQAGAYFIPEEAGKYTLSFKAKDAAGNESELQGEIDVFSEKPQYLLTLYGEIRAGKIGKGSTISVPRATAESNLALNGDCFVYADILLDGQTVYTAAADGFDYTFEEGGDYTVRYRSEFSGITETEEYDIEVSEEIAFLTLDQELGEIVPAGTRFRVPKGELTFDGKTVVADAVITYPSGAQYHGNYVTLSEYGYYKLIYSAEFNGATHIAERYFKCVHEVESLFSSNAEIETSALYRRMDEAAGVAVTETLGKGGVEFLLPVNMQGKTRADTLIELAAWPFIAGVRDYNELYIRLTDADDPTNTVSVKIAQESWNATTPACYAKATHSNLQYVGVETADRIYRGDSAYGFYLNHSFAGNTDRPIERNTIKLSMDYEKGLVFLENTACSPPESAGTEDGAVVNLKSTEYFSTAWTGFKADRCYISVEAGGYVGVEARYLILQIAGFDLSGEVLAYDAPAIEVDFEKNDHVPQGIIGVAYPVFSVGSVDVFGDTADCSVRVYANYNTVRQFEVDVKDGAFVPHTADIYTIVYKTSDGLGNQRIVTVDVPVTSVAETFTLELLEPPEENPLAGTGVKIPEAVWKNERGRVIVEAEAVNKENGESIPCENGGVFVPASAGTYIIKYTACDWLGRVAETQYETTVLPNPVPVFEQELKLLPVYTSGQSYQLPELTVKDYSGEVVEDAELSIWAEYPDGTKENIENFTFEPSAEHGESVKIVYAAETEGGGKNEISAIVPVLTYSTENYNIDMIDYFYRSGVTAQYKDIETVFSAEYDEASFTFGKPLSAASLNLRFSMEAASNSFNTLRIRLTDAEDPHIAVELRIEKDAQTSRLGINKDTKTVRIYGSFWGNDPLLGSNYDFVIGYNNSDFRIRDASMASIMGIEKDLYGNPFNGFPSGEAFVTFVFEGVSGNASVSLLQFNNQFIGDTAVDSVKPQILVNGDIGGIVELGYKGIIPSASVSDVLTYVSGATVSVRKIGGEYLTALDGTLLKNADADKTYETVFQEYGKYEIIYSAQDENGNVENTVPRTVYIPTSVLPEYTLSSEMPETARVGKEMRIPNMRPTGSEDVTWYVILFDNHFTQTVLFSSKTQEYTDMLSFTPNEAGEYIIRYYMFDTDYNYVMDDFSVTVN